MSVILRTGRRASWSRATISRLKSKPVCWFYVLAVASQLSIGVICRWAGLGWDDAVVAVLLADFGAFWIFFAGLLWRKASR